MRKIILFFSLFGVLLVSSGCLETMGQKVSAQKITIQKRTGEDNIFENFREVTEKTHVEEAIELVKNANWDNVKVEMSSYADYQFQFSSKNSSGSEDKIMSYLLWISPNGENLEIVTDGGKYVKLTNQDSEDLYEILTGEVLIK